MTIRKKGLLVLCYISFLLSCQNGVDSKDGNLITQEILFEVQHINFAWGYTLKGFYIDNEGNWYRYNHSDEQWRPSRYDAFSEEELLEKYSHSREFGGTIKYDTLLEKYNLIDSASKGELSVPVSRCRDSGGTSYSAYVFDADSSLYKPVLLYLVGDWAQKNLSDSGRLLYELLRTIESDYSDPPCEPPL